MTTTSNIGRQCSHHCFMNRVFLFLAAVTTGCAASGNSWLLTFPLHKLTYTPEEDNRRLEPVPVFDEDDHDPLFRGFGTHYVTLYVGCSDNPQPQTVIIDTGSSHIGFPCSSCVEECGQEYHLNLLYDESQSSCFAPLHCDYCNCDDDRQCRVTQSYAEGSSWTGYQAIDSFRIGSPDEEPVRLLFTCQDEITHLFVTQRADGIAGLSPDPHSLFNQVYLQQIIDKQQFSLCMINEQTPESSAGLLVLGGAEEKLNHSPMVFARAIDHPMYWVVKIQNIYAVAGGNTTNTFSNGDWATVSLDDMSDYDLKPIVDSGSTFTNLPASLESPMREIWNQLTDLSFDSYVYTSDDVKQMPTFVFQLQGDGENEDLPAVTEDRNHVYPNGENEDLPAVTEDRNHVYPNDILVSFPPSAYLHILYDTGFENDVYYERGFYFQYGRPVLGADFLSGHNVLFDLENKRIGFAASDCVLDDTASTKQSPIFPATNDTTTMEDVNSNDEPDGFPLFPLIDPFTSIDDLRANDASLLPLQHCLGWIVVLSCFLDLHY